MDEPESVSVEPSHSDVVDNLVAATEHARSFGWIARRVTHRHQFDEAVWQWAEAERRISERIEHYDIDAMQRSMFVAAIWQNRFLGPFIRGGDRMDLAMRNKHRPNRWDKFCMGVRVFFGRKP